jgi:error-prone DNA polymerase
MGFYHPATIVKDAERHGTPVLPIDVNRSNFLCTWEPHPKARGEDRGAVRMGLRYVKGLRQPAGEAIEKERALAPFRDAADLKRRAGLRADEMERLAHAGALKFDVTRRGALWQVAELARPAGELFEGLPLDTRSPLPEMNAVEETLADYESTSLTTGPHLIEHLRPQLNAEGVLSTRQLERCRDGDWVKAGGSVIVRQRPGTAKGFVFLSIEDETGIFQAIVRPDLFRDERAVIVGSSGLIVEGRVQKQDGTLSIKAAKLTPLVTANAEIPSHDFR